MKKIFIVLSFLFVFILCGCKDKNWFDPWDNLGGGGDAEIGDVDDTIIEDYKPDDYVDVKDEQLNDQTKNEKNINLSDLSNLPSGVKYEKDEVVITEAGEYEVTGSFKGSIIVDGFDGDCKLVLANVNIETKDGSLNPAILFKKNSGLRILTVKEGTVNYLKDNVSNVGDDAEEAVIAVKKSSLTINGKGELNLNGVGENSSGIKVKKELTIIDTKIKIECNNNGIKADEKIILKGANITIKALGDGIKTDIEATDEEEKVKFVSDPGYGYIYIKDTTLDIESGDDGICANNSMYIDNTVSNTITVMTNGGAPANVTEYSSDNADGKAIKVDGVTYVNEETDEEVDLKASYEENYSLVIVGGVFDINSNDDAISSKGNLIIAGGMFYISTGDDAFHAEYLTRISGGEISISKSYEGIEGASVEIYGGDISVVSKDDGINAANADLTGYDYHIYITGEKTKVVVNAEGDGVDSNGWFKMENGVLIIYGPTNGGNGSLDTDKGFVIAGGTLISLGSVGMNENPSSSSTQPYVNVNLKQSQNANVEIEIYDENDELIYSITSIKKFQSVIVSLDNFELNNKYKIVIGEEVYDAILEKIGTALGTNQFGGGNQGGGGRPPGGYRPK